jgi:uncharacterized RDD family membrane protein YckC
MSPPLRFETPENVELHYEPAGAGSRFLAWLLDQIILWFVMVIALVGILLIGASFDFALEDSGWDFDEQDPALFYFAGLATLIWGLGSFVYFTGSELLLRGQTIGKRIGRLRVVKGDGFQLDAASVLTRNLFRVLDNLPPMWIVPVMSHRGQRIGDMVAGTLVISEAKTALSAVRTVLAGRAALEAQFRFDLATLKRLSDADFQAIEQILNRLASLPTQEQQRLLSVATDRITAKLGVQTPPADQYGRFLEDLLAAEFRRRDRSLV